MISSNLLSSIDQRNVQNNQLTKFSTEFVTSLSQCEEYKKQVSKLFIVVRADSSHFRVSFVFIVTDVRKRIICHAANPIITEAHASSTNAHKIFQGSQVGKHVQHLIAR